MFNMCYKIKNWQNVLLVSLFLYVAFYIGLNGAFFFRKISWTTNISARRRAIVFYVCGLHPSVLENARIFVPFRPGPLSITSIKNSLTILSRCSSMGGTRLTDTTWRCTRWYMMSYVRESGKLSENKVIFCGIIFIVDMGTDKLQGGKGSQPLFQASDNFVEKSVL